MRILAPGVGHAVLRYHRAKLRIRQHIHPRCGRDLRGRGVYYVLVSIGREPAEAIVQNEIASDFNIHRGFGAVIARWLQTRYPHFPQAAAIELFRQRATAIAENDARHRLKQNAVFARHLFRGAHENAARLINHMRFDARCNHANNLILQQLPVTGVIFVPDHQVHRQSF